MQFIEMGRDDGKTLVLLPGTACTWQVNFARVIDGLAERCQQHFREPDLMRFDMQHEEWLFGSTWTDTVLAAIDEKTGIA
ncbi:MAG: hypothetical protein K5859_08295 [Atopobiaceae bacterium]|nr:hypothetical protein [Atopobiaceae bacterium]